jgi:hypothetical protein
MYGSMLASPLMNSINSSNAGNGTISGMSGGGQPSPAFMAALAKANAGESNFWNGTPQGSAVANGGPTAMPVSNPSLNGPGTNPNFVPSGGGQSGQLQTPQRFGNVARPGGQNGGYRRNNGMQGMNGQGQTTMVGSQQGGFNGSFPVQGPMYGQQSGMNGVQGMGGAYPGYGSNMGGGFNGNGMSMSAYPGMSSGGGLGGYGGPQGGNFGGSANLGSTASMGGAPYPSRTTMSGPVNMTGNPAAGNLGAFAGQPSTLGSPQGGTINPGNTGYNPGTSYGPWSSGM